MSVLQDRARGLIRLLAEDNEYTPAVNTAVVAVWDAAWKNADNEDASLVSLAITLADRVTDFYLYDGTAEKLDLAARCFLMADLAITNEDLGAGLPMA
jgi:hypothetical protein